MSFTPSEENEQGLLWVASKQTLPSNRYPSYDGVVSTWQDAQRFFREWLSHPGRPAQGVQWVGNAPRVTRRHSGVTDVVTTVVWPFRIPSGVPMELRQNYARQFVNGSTGDTQIGEMGRRAASLDATVESELPTDGDPHHEIGTTWAVGTVTPYSVQANGPLSGWTSGAMANTRTREGTRFGIIDQNAYGPDTDATTPTSLYGDVFGSSTNKTDYLKWAAIILVPVAVAWSLSSASNIATSGLFRRRRPRE